MGKDGICMRIGFISDIHLDYNRHHDFIKALKQIISEHRIDIMVFAGDTATGAPDALDFYRAIAAQTSAAIRIVPGNHDLYVTHAKNCGTQWIRDKAAEYKNMLSDHPDYSLLRNPVVTDHWFITGIDGWYDYSFDKRFPNINLEKLAKKQIGGTPWPDYTFIDGGDNRPDRDILKVKEDLDLLKKILNSPAASGKKRCVVMHMLPTRELVVPRKVPLYDTGVTFLGSEEYRRLFEEEKIDLNISGHSHMRCDKVINGIRYVNVSLGYNYKWNYPLDAVREIEDALFVLED